MHFLFFIVDAAIANVVVTSVIDIAFRVTIA
jgi:hypothetical protein